MANELEHCPVCREAQPVPFRQVGGKDYLRCLNCEATIMAPHSRLTAAQEREIYELHDNDPGDAGYRRFLANWPTR